MAAKKKSSELKQQVAAALAAAEDKKAEQISILEMDKDAGGFTDYFVICSGTNPRQIQSIADEIELRLKQAGLHPLSVEGYKQAEWVLLDYVDFVVHIFSEKARQFYDLERLWKSAKRLEPAELLAKPKTRRAVIGKATIRKTSIVKTTIAQSAAANPRSRKARDLGHPAKTAFAAPKKARKKKA